MIASLPALLLLSSATSLEVRVPGPTGTLQRDPVGAREGYDRLPTQDLAPEVLATLGTPTAPCSCAV